MLSYKIYTRCDTCARRTEPLDGIPPNNGDEFQAVLQAICDHADHRGWRVSPEGFVTCPSCPLPATEPQPPAPRHTAEGEQ